VAQISVMDGATLAFATRIGGVVVAEEEPRLALGKVDSSGARGDDVKRVVAVVLSWGGRERGIMALLGVR